MRRRSFLTALALSPLCAASCQSHKATSPKSAPSLPGDDCQAAHRDAHGPRILTPAQWDALEGACERILPKDKDPGARDVRSPP